MGAIYLVRHGQASFGAADYDCLSDLGVEQSRLLGRWFADCEQRFDRAVSGGLKRHNQTAEACLGAMPEHLRPKDECWKDAGFEEYDHREVLIRYRPDFADGESTKRLLAQSDNPRKAFQKFFAEAMARWMDGKHDAEYRESWAQFQKRCNDAMQRCAEQTASAQNTVVFTSGGAIAAIVQALLGVSASSAAMLNFGLVNSAVTKLLCQPGRVSLSYMNAFPHLERGGQPQNITYR